MSRAKAVVGGGVYVALNGKKYAKVQSWSASPSNATRPIHGLDSLVPFELALGPTRCTGRLTVYRTRGDAGAEGAGMVAMQKDLPRQKYFTIQVIERGSDTVVFEARFCTLTSQSWSVSAKGIVVGTLDFESLDYSNELQFQ